MNIKIDITVLFCVALYFFQCQGVDLTSQELELISRTVEEYDKNNPTMNLTGVVDVIMKVKEQINSNKEIPSVDALKPTGSNYIRTLSEVETYIYKYVYGYKRSPPDVAKLLAYKYKETPDGIHLTDDYKLTRKEVKRIVANYFSSK